MALEPASTTKFPLFDEALAARPIIHPDGPPLISVDGFPGIVPALTRVPAAPFALLEKREPLTVNGSGLILLVDDEETVLLLTGLILQRHGYKVLTAANGEIALQKVRESKSQLALVILDLIMPVMGGVETFAGIKAIAPELPVLLMTGYDASRAIELFHKDALVGFLQKPCTVPHLLETVKAALQREKAASTKSPWIAS